MSDIGKRFKELRKNKRLTQEGLGNIISVSKQAIANIESSHNKPSIEIISKLIENMNVNANWLIAGLGNMFIAPQFEDAKDEILKEVDEVLIKYGVKNK